MKFNAILFLIVLCQLEVGGQNVIPSINQASFNNYSNTYNYTHWDENWKTLIASRSFTNYTSSYALNIDYSSLSINSLLINDQPVDKEQALDQLNTDIFPQNYSGDISYAVLQNGNVIHQKSLFPTNLGKEDSQLAEYGTWSNTRFISTNFTNNLAKDDYFTGIEFTNWHDLMKVTFHLKPTATISNGQLRMTWEMPSEYAQYYNTGNIHAFALPSNKGFACKGGTKVSNLTVNGNEITIYSAQQNLIAGQSYEISLIFYAITDNLSTTYSSIFNKDAEITISGTQTSTWVKDITDDVTYDDNLGLHYIDIPRINMGYYNCPFVNRLQNINLQLLNTSTEERKVRLCFRRIPNINVTGFNSLLVNNNGDPSGLPLQVSKNWHTTTAQLFSGEWIREYTEIIIPANTKMLFRYKCTGAKWGETYSASSHQLSVAGAGVPRGGWLEAAIGTFGENITHSPDYEYGNSTGADIRPFLLTNGAYGGNSTQCGWTGNVGGLDIGVFVNGNNNRQYHKQVKTDFKRYSPNLTETTISSVTSDLKLKIDYTFYLNRSDDFTRVYYRINYKALANTSFNRFDLFQLGGDIYNFHNTQSVAYGNDNGLLATFSPTNNGSNNYTTSAIALTGNHPWLWAGDGLFKNGASGGLDINTNNAMIIRDYSATFNGQQNNIPYVRERSSSQGFSSTTGNNPTSYCLVPPPGVTSLSAGDEISLLVEVVILPKQGVDYYGPNQNFANALNNLGNSYHLLYREAQGNKIIASSPTNTIDTDYPLTVQTTNNEGLVNMTGGRGYVPIVFTGLTNVDNPTLWKAEDNCWEIVDQSLHVKDFWQSNYNSSTGSFDLIYNVDQDRPNDVLANVQYYLGDNPPVPQLINQTLIVGNNWSSSDSLNVTAGIDSVRLAPQVLQYGNTSVAINSNYSWTGPNGFSQTGRVVNIYPVTNANFGTYVCTYTNEYGCSDAISIVISEEVELSIQLTVCLEGPQIPQGSMRNTLQQLNLLPDGQPYDTSPWNYFGSEGAGWTSADYPPNTVDWVLISLRETVSSSSVIAKRAALVLQDGTISTTVFIPNERLLNTHYIVIEHRNHLPAMTPIPLAINNQTLSFDFTQADSYTGGGSTGQKLLNGAWCLYACNGDQSNPAGYEITGSDNILWQSSNGTFLTYLNVDYDMNGDVNANDKILWIFNNGVFSAIPK